MLACHLLQDQLGLLPGGHGVPTEQQRPGQPRPQLGAVRGQASSCTTPQYCCYCIASPPCRSLWAACLYWRRVVR